MATVATFAGSSGVPRIAVRDVAARLVAEGLFWLVVLQLITGIYLQSQMLVFDGRIVVPNGAPKLLLVLSIFVLGGCAVLLRRGEIKFYSCMFPACIFTCYLAADVAWLAATNQLPTGALLFGVHKYFAFFAAIPAAAMLRLPLSSRQVTFRFLVLMVPLVCLALAQYAANDPLIPVASEDELYEIPAVEFYGQIRAFSLFRGVLECGQGMAFFAALVIAELCLNRRRHAVLNGILLMLAAAGCMVTFRRGAYLECGAASLSALAIGCRWSVSRWLPWMYLVLGLCLASGGTLLSAVEGDGVLSWESLAERHDAWQMVLDKWLLREDASLFLGTGLAQIESEEIDYFLVDNGFLAVGAELGLIGLALWCWVMHSLWRDMLGMAWRTRSSLAIAVAALLSTWMMRDVFDPLFALYPLYAFLVFWTVRDEARPETSATTPPEVWA